MGDRNFEWDVIREAERDRKREFHEKVMRDQALAERDRLARVVEAALSEYDCVGGMPWDEVADIAIKALVDDGVIFAYVGPDEASAIGGSEGSGNGASD